MLPATRTAARRRCTDPCSRATVASRVRRPMVRLMTTTSVRPMPSNSSSGAQTREKPKPVTPPRTLAPRTTTPPTISSSTRVPGSLGEEDAGLVHGVLPHRRAGDLHLGCRQCPAVGADAVPGGVQREEPGVVRGPAQLAVPEARSGPQRHEEDT